MNKLSTVGHTGIHAWGNRVRRQFFGGGAVVVAPRNLHVYQRPGHNEPGWFADMSEAVKAQVNIPVILTGGVRISSQAEALLEAGAADLIGVGRAMLRNPNWGAEPYG